MPPWKKTVSSDDKRGTGRVNVSRKTKHACVPDIHKKPCLGRKETKPVAGRAPIRSTGKDPQFGNSGPCMLLARVRRHDNLVVRAVILEKCFNPGSRSRYDGFESIRRSPRKVIKREQAVRRHQYGKRTLRLSAEKKLRDPNEANKIDASFERLRPGNEIVKHQCSSRQASYAKIFAGTKFGALFHFLVFLLGSRPYSRAKEMSPDYLDSLVYQLASSCQAAKIGWQRSPDQEIKHLIAPSPPGVRPIKPSKDLQLDLSMNNTIKSAPCAAHAPCY
ncbi:hypothetical protein DFH11DRAFT_1551101 [Phellopilus nigrolimitatus]|nr:hypothetical protein DFH11DRAFT_1551101 [Phellopilus nigrolimitatus]